MARRSRSKSGVSLPWEQRGQRLRALIAGARWRALFALALLAGVLWLFWSTADRRARERETRTAIADVRRAVAAFRAQVGRCPRTATELVHPPMARTRYLREMPKDGWGRELHFACPGHDDPDDVDVLSAGPSGSFFIDDNVQ